MSFLFHVCGTWCSGLLAGTWDWEGGRSIEHLALCMHDKEGGNPNTSLGIEGTKEKGAAFMLF